MTKPKANIFDLPLDQKFLIVATWLSTEYLAEIAIAQGRPHDILIDGNSGFVFKRLGSEFPSEAKIDFFLKALLEVRNL
jgi:hypothetical protein